MSRLHLDRISLRGQIRLLITALICCLTLALAAGLGAYGSQALRNAGHRFHLCPQMLKAAASA